MKEIIVPSLAEPVGRLWRNLQNETTPNKTLSVASPLSSTPIPIYEWIIQNKESFQNWDKVKFVLMDEMLEEEHPPFEYVSLDDPASYEGFANKHLLEPLGENIVVVKPEIKQIEGFNTEIDLLILAIGIKGNYANVMPGTPDNIGWQVAHLTPEYRQSHTQESSESYAGANFREYGMSLGPQQVLSAKNVVVIISGEKKKDLYKELKSHDSFDPEFPISIIYHPKVADRVSTYVTQDTL